MISGADIFDIIISLFNGCTQFCSWLIKPYHYSVLGASISFRPIYILTFSTFIVVFGLHVWHLIKPVG